MNNAHALRRISTLYLFIAMNLQPLEFLRWFLFVSVVGGQMKIFTFFICFMLLMHFSVSGAQISPCASGISDIYTSTGLVIPLFAEKYTTPAINIKYNDVICYANLESGQASEAINIVYDGNVYHTVAEIPGDCSERAFCATFSDVTSVSFLMSAAGTFNIDWGDGKVETIERSDTDMAQYSHSYVSNGDYTMKLEGNATAYSKYTEDPAIIFIPSADSLTSISGSLGAVFPTLGSGKGYQPSFYTTFEGTQITSIPENLFAGITGTTVPDMFYGTFIYTPITSIPENLFAGLDTNAPLADWVFYSTFSGCASLTGPSARINGKYLYEIWPNATNMQVSGTYSGATGLSDYANIPNVWK